MPSLPVEVPDVVEGGKDARILAAALSAFAERGFHGTSIPHVLAAANVGASALYRRFESKEALVNAVFRDAKGRLGQALRDGLDMTASPRALFDDLWSRLARFAREEQTAFRFLELQDHAPYLDQESRMLEIAVLSPIYLAILDFQRQGAMRADVAADLIMASVWGAFVGIFKAERHGYVKLDARAIDAARDACWRAFADDGATTDRSAKTTRRSPKTQKATPHMRKKGTAR